MLICFKMKKIFKLCAKALVAVVLLAVVVYNLVNRAPSSELPQNVQVSEIFKAGGCLSCLSMQNYL